MLSKHDVSLHVLDLDLQTGVADVEVCVRNACHIGIHRTTLVITAPDSLVEAVRMATKDLLEQGGSK